ncbi:hypothetical protein [Gordonia phthalatica]|uniref:Ig-like domain-containing protein n=1 Tax=Gordonia phthalatica TaxID=1136941 RepID=A0A0N9NFN6_9ACTN|nr:hypothetical protein [Gordonia phthalatica]ALG84114.1 hypothetical protein ACH46_05840 [Gordonia phthalatica]
MRLARSRRTAAAIAAAAMITPALLVPSTAAAAPADDVPAAEQNLPLPDVENAPEVEPKVLESLGALTPALIGSVATRDADGGVNTALLAQVRTLADNPAVPAEAQEVWKSLIDFLGEPGAKEAAKTFELEAKPAAKKDDAPNIPTGPNKPRIQQFLYPTIGLGCMPGGGNSVGMALTTAGPQAAPAPGPKRGQAGIVYTSLGTGPALRSAQKLTISWLNIDTGRTGQQALNPNPKINAQKGPGTFTAIVNTGRGRIVSTIYGTVTTKTKGKRVSCTIAPTIGTAII